MNFRILPHCQKSMAGIMAINYQGADELHSTELISSIFLGQAIKGATTICEILKQVLQLVKEREDA